MSTPLFESNIPALAVSAPVVFSVRAPSATRLSMKSYRASSGSCKLALRLMQFSSKLLLVLQVLSTTSRFDNS